MFLPSKQSNKTLGVRTIALADCSIEKYDKQFYKFISKSRRTETFMFAMVRSDATILLDRLMLLRTINC